MKYNLSLIFFPQEGGGYCVECPELKVCFSEGDTIEEAEAAIRELIPEWLEAETRKSKDDEELFRLGSCLPGKMFKEFTADVSDAGEVILPSYAKSERIAV